MSAPPAPVIFGPATLDDLMRVEGKAELVAGRIIHTVGSGHTPSRVAFKIAIRLEQHSDEVGVGIAYCDGISFAQIPPLANGRQSFSPDACYYVGPLPKNEMRYIEGTPVFAVEVRSENDYGPRAEADMEAKRADYFEAGTLIVWDVDPEAKTVAAYRNDPATPIETYRPGDVADAEPALVGWRLAVADIFR